MFSLTNIWSDVDRITRDLIRDLQAKPGNLSIRLDVADPNAETIIDASPLIRNECAKQPKPIQPLQIYKAVHNLYLKAGLIGSKNGRLYEIRPHSIRKFFHTQLTALGVQNDYVEYMMGHTISTYHNIQSKEVEFLRTIYTTADLQINQKEKPGIYDLIEEIVKSKGYSINRELLHKAIAQPHRTIASREELEEEK